MLSLLFVWLFGCLVGWLVVVDVVDVVVVVADVVFVDDHGG